MIVPVRLSNGNYDIHLSNKAYETLGRDLEKRGTEYFLVADRKAYEFHGESFLGKLPVKPAGMYFIQGEKDKNLTTISSILESAAQAGITRSGCFIAFGGGVCGDITGFAASVYMRGISYYQVPTTLLSQVDSSVGGKTGVDLEAGKNLAGSFIQPAGVYIDPGVINTLGKSEIAQGKAEMIKAAAIYDEGLFTRFEKNMAVFEENIRRCIEIKLDYVGGDEFDTGRRMILNFGHTIAHALEKTIGYGRISHGEAVAVGMSQSVKISENAGITEKGTAKRLVKLLMRENLPVKSSIEFSELAKAMANDKKISNGKLNAVFLEKIGKATIYKMSLGEFVEMGKSTWMSE